ncbi:MAG: alpha/beta hydrolase [Chloroflexi bacterium]|nr:alpha/beta hydrolase [Chloroflexota bacterium]
MATALASAQDNHPHYEASDCPEIALWMASAELGAIRCGLLHVREDRAAGGGSAMLRLFVLRLAAQNERGNAPIVYLAGGPGGAASAALEGLLSSALRSEHEIILIDQRGAGLSQPALNCPEIDAGASENPLAACRARLLAAGIDLAAYNTSNSAQDINELLIALDLPTANIYGISYGARLALTMARDFPQRLGAMILDGVSPPQAQLLTEQAVNGNRAFERLFADCAADPACRQAYPNLRASFNQVIDRLNQAPAEIAHLRSGAATWMDGEIWVNYLFDLLYDTSLLAWLPAMIRAHAAGDYGFAPPEMASLAKPESALQLPDFALQYDADSEGLYYSIICAEAVPFESAEGLLAAGARLPPRTAAALSNAALQLLADCELWGLPAAAASHKRPVISAIPTLLFSGAYDPVSPPAWAVAAAQGLETSWRFVLPDTGHGALGNSDCADTIALEFLRQPTQEPASDCLEALRPPVFRSQ